MTNRDTLYRKLVELLAKAGFHTQYFAFFDAHRAQKDNAMKGAARSHFDAALASTGSSFKYHSSDKFFEHRENVPNGSVSLKVAFPNSAVELMLGVTLQGETVGAPFPKLALDAGKSIDAAFEHTPPYPKLPFSNAAELQEAVTFGLSLFNEAKRAIAAHDWSK